MIKLESIPITTPEIEDHNKMMYSLERKQLFSLMIPSHLLGKGSEANPEKKETKKPGKKDK